MQCLASNFLDLPPAMKKKMYYTLLLNITNSLCIYTRHQIDYMTQYNIGQWEKEMNHSRTKIFWTNLPFSTSLVN